MFIVILGQKSSRDLLIPGVFSSLIISRLMMLLMKVVFMDSPDHIEVELVCLLLIVIHPDASNRALLVRCHLTNRTLFRLIIKPHLVI